MLLFFVISCVFWWTDRTKWHEQNASITEKKTLDRKIKEQRFEQDEKKKYAKSILFVTTLKLFGISYNVIEFSGAEY